MKRIQSCCKKWLLMLLLMVVLDVISIMCEKHGYGLYCDSAIIGVLVYFLWDKLVAIYDERKKNIDKQNDAN